MNKCRLSLYLEIHGVQAGTATAAHTTHEEMKRRRRGAEEEHRGKQKGGLGHRSAAVIQVPGIRHLLL